MAIPGVGVCRSVAAGLALLAFAVWLSGSVVAGELSPLFTREEVARYQPKGPSCCFRQICLEYNNPTRRKKVFTAQELGEFFSAADAVKYAQFCRDIHLDAALMLAVPQGGYTTYLQTKAGEPYPYLKRHGFDFFAR